MRTLISKGRVSLPIFTATLALALAFTISCSNDDNSPPPPKSGEISYYSSYGGSSDSKALCSNESYDPSIYRCEMGELIGKCRGNDYYVAYERCIDGVVVNNNSNNNSSSSSITSSSSDTPQSSSSIVHSSSSVVPSSSSEAISSSSSMLSSSSVCTAANNTSTEYCSNGTMKQYGFVTYAGQTYKTVEIGTQVWFQRNLNYNIGNSKCGNGTTLSDANTSTCDIYGRLYNWSTAMALFPGCNSSLCYLQISTKHQGICPSGWHIPSKEDWNVLMKFVDPSCSDNSNCTNAVTKLKAASGWNAYDEIPGDDYGFSAMPGGIGSSNGNFIFVGYDGYWWSSTEGNEYSAYSWHIYYNFMDVYNGTSSQTKTGLLSVRCVKD